MSDRFVVATRKGLFTFARKSGKAGEWSVARTDFLGDNVSMVLHDVRDGRLHAALDHGHFGVKMHRADEAKRDWQELPAPAYPPKPEGLEENDMWGRPLPWSTVRVWALETGGPAAPGVLWCGTIPGGLFKSSNGGDTWEIVGALWHHPDRPKWMGGGADLPGLHHICVDPRSPNTIRAGVSTGGVWQSDDGGASWNVRGEGLRAEYVPPEHTHHPMYQDVHALVQSRGDPDRLWIQHHNGVFLSPDSGATWREVTNVPVSTFGFAVRVHPRDGKTAWFVPAINDQKRIPDGGRFVVTRTQDAGATFEVLNRGLPAEHAYDIVFRHGLDLDREGRRLVMGSSTGSVWVSEDAGESWTCAAGRLPPVYCVRFLDQ
jgi:hypothetical protein